MKKYIVFFVFLLFVSACSQKPKTALELAKTGDEAMAEKDYGDAIKAYGKLKDQFPFSPYTLGAELHLADAYFFDQKYLLAAEAYKEFASLHPRNENMAYVLFQTGMANFNQITTIDLPQEHIDEALEYFYRVKQSYPDSSYAEKAGDYVYKCRLHQARHEIFVADFYWQRDLYRAAWSRYWSVARSFEDFAEIALYARQRAQMAYLRDLEQESRKTMEKEKGSWKQWFDWL